MYVYVVTITAICCTVLLKLTGGNIRTPVWPSPVFLLFLWSVLFEQHISALTLSGTSHLVYTVFRYVFYNIYPIQHMLFIVFFIIEKCLFTNFFYSGFLIKKIVNSGINVVIILTSYENVFFLYCSFLSCDVLILVLQLIEFLIKARLWRDMNWLMRIMKLWFFFFLFFISRIK